MHTYSQLLMPPWATGREEGGLFASDPPNSVETRLNCGRLHTYEKQPVFRKTTSDRMKDFNMMLGGNRATCI